MVSVGKTSLVDRYVTGKMQTGKGASVGADFSTKKYTHNGKNYNCQFWDTAGQEQFKSLGGAFYRGSDCCVIVYDMTNKKVRNSF